MIKSISDVKVLPEQSNKRSVKATSRSNRTTTSSTSSNAKRILLVELEAMKKQDEIDEQLAAARRKAEMRRKQHEIDTLTEKLEIAKLEESARTKQMTNQEKALARNGIRLRPTQSQKVTKQLQPCKVRRNVIGPSRQSRPQQILLQDMNCVSKRLTPGKTDTK